MLSSRFLKQSLVTASVITITANVLSRVFGYFREAAIANYFGTTEIFDVFILAFTVPELVAAIIFTALPAALLPVLKKIPERSPDDYSKAFWSGLITLSFLFAVISILIFALRGEILSWLAPQLTPEYFLKGKRLLAILSLFIFFRGTEAYFRSWLFEKKHFIVPAFSNIVMNIVILVVLFIFYDKFDIEALAYGWLGASVILFIYNGVSVLYVVKPGYWPIINSFWVRILFQSLLAIAALESISLIYPLIDRYLAAKWLGPGQIAALRYAMVIIQIPASVFVVAFNITSFPWISDFSSPGQFDELRNLYLKGIRLLIYVMGPVAVAIVIFSREIIAVAFQRGAFNMNSMILTSGPLIFYALGIVFFSVYIFQMRFYYAQRTLLRLGLILSSMLFLKLLLSVIMARPLEQNGLALATAITWAIGFAIMTADLRQILRISLKELWYPSIFKTIFLILAVSVYWIVVRNIWAFTIAAGITQIFIKLSIFVISGISLYLGLAFIIKHPEQQLISSSVISKLRGSKEGR